MKRLFCAFLCVITLCFTCSVSAGAVNVTEKQVEFVPVIRFVASSDSHVRDDDDLTAGRIGTMMEQAYAFAGEDAQYTNVDALLIAGDVTNDGTQSEFDKLKDAVYGALKQDTRFLAVAAKNHDGYDMSRSEVRSAISAVTGNDADFHVVINGYHFIGISVSSHSMSHYDDEQLAWLKEQLDAATAEDANKPVFVMQHEHVKDTVYGSSDFERWYVKHFSELFKQYPQIVDFSGHSHYPLNHPNSVWQGEFTAIGTGAIYYTDYTAEDLHDFSDDATNKNVSNYWLVELDAANNMRLRGIDLVAGKVLCDYYLENPANPQNRNFTPEKKAQASTAPVFEADDKLLLEAHEGGCTVTIPAAKSTDGMPVVLYRAYATDESGKVIVKTWTLPWYFDADAGDTVSLELRGLGKGNYKVSVVAETAYGVQSEALEGEVSISSPGRFVAFLLRIGMWMKHMFNVIWRAII
ncbi:MAG: metallophosphoesterase [Clostridia bacterium]|nr:metallophosphoesterase [Clostridia bacterium]